MSLETDLEKKFVKEVRMRGGEAYKFVSPGCSGVPDRLVVLPGNRIGFVELKRKGEKPRADQMLRISRLKELDCFATVLDDEADIREIVTSISLCNDDRDTRLVMELVEDRKEKRK